MTVRWDTGPMRLRAQIRGSRQTGNIRTKDRGTADAGCGSWTIQGDGRERVLTCVGG